jgi:hypothetical protein
MNLNLQAFVTNKEEAGGTSPSQEAETCPRGASAAKGTARYLRRCRTAFSGCVPWYSDNLALIFVQRMCSPQSLLHLPLRHRQFRRSTSRTA